MITPYDKGCGKGEDDCYEGMLCYTCRMKREGWIERSKSDKIFIWNLIYKHLECKDLMIGTCTFINEVVIYFDSDKGVDKK